MTECVLEDREGVFAALEAHYGGRETLARIMETVATPPRMTLLRCQGCHYDAADPRAVTLAELEARVRAALGPERASHFAFVRGVCGLPDLLGLVPHATSETEEEKDDDDDEDALPAVVVDARCGEAVLRGAHVFAPGVVACERRVAVGARVVLYADVRGALQRGAVCGGAGALRGAGRGAFVRVGTGVARLARAALFDAFAAAPVRGVAVEVVRAAGPEMPPLNGVAADCAVLQNLPSVLAGCALAPAPGARVLDMCAAPGGKTAHLAALMRDRGELVAVDRRAARVAELAALVARLRLTCVRTLQADATRLRARFPDAAFDAVLLDAPCSGLGLRPRLAEPCRAAELPARAAYQRRLAREAVRLVRPGGTLVYSVCTLNPDEGENTVAFVLRELAPAARLVLVDALPPAPDGARIGAPGLASSELDPASCALVRRFVPPVASHGDHDEDDSIDAAIHDWPAFFLAKFVKLAD